MLLLFLQVREVYGATRIERYKYGRFKTKKLFLLDMDGTIYIDTELSFQKLEDACILLGKGVDYVATNPDWVCPTWYGFVPDCGSVSEVLYNAIKRRPLFIGKPQSAMVELALEKTGFKKEEAIVIGDRLYTDIACGVNAGIAALLFSVERELWRILKRARLSPNLYLKT